MQSAQRRGRGVENVDLMLVNYLPEATRVRIGRYTLEYHRRRAIAQRSIDNVAVACDPANIGCTPENLAVTVVEYVVKARCGVEQVTARGVKHALGLSG